MELFNRFFKKNMVYDSYNELVTYIENLVTEAINEMSYTIEQAVAYSFDTYFFYDGQHHCENLIVITTCINILIDKNVNIHEGFIKRFNEYVKLTENDSFLISQLKEDELEQLEESIKRVENHLNDEKTKL